MKKDIDIDAIRKRVKETPGLIESLNSSQSQKDMQPQGAALPPKWHLLANEVMDLQKRAKESRKVYSLTQNVIAQNARNPRLPVLPTTNLTWGHLFYTVLNGLDYRTGGKIRLEPFPSAIYPYNCWHIYGRVSALETLWPEYGNFNLMQSDLAAVYGDIRAFYMPEYNPDVSLSYVWGNVAYSTTRLGRLKTNYLPNRMEYEQGEADYIAIMDEEQYDNPD